MDAAAFEQIYQDFQGFHAYFAPGCLAAGRRGSAAVKETRRPRPARPGAAGSYDYEYERNGVSNLFMLFAIICKPCWCNPGSGATPRIYRRDGS